MVETAHVLTDAIYVIVIVNVVVVVVVLARANYIHMASTCATGDRTLPRCPLPLPVSNPLPSWCRHLTDSHYM